MMKTSARWLTPLVIAVLIAPLISSAQGQEAADEQLVQLVPDDIALCLVVNNLRDQYRILAKSKMAQRLQKSPIGKMVFNSTEFASLKQLSKKINKDLGIDWQRIRDEILGDRVVFAFHHQSSAGGKNERGLLLVRARDDKLLANLIERVNRAQLASNEVKKIAKRRYQGVEYYQRVLAKGHDQFYLRSKSVFAFTNRESVLKGLIARLNRESSASSSSRVAQSLQKLRHASALLTVWLNPRAFDNDLKKTIHSAKKEDQPILQALTRYWRALDACAFSVVVHPNLELLLSFQGRSKGLPAPTRKLLPSSSAADPLPKRFPKKSILAIHGRLNFVALFKVFEELMTPDVRRQVHKSLQKDIGSLLGKDFFKEVLPNLGPDFGLYVAAAADKTRVPQGLFALRIQSGNAMDRAIMSSLHTYVWLWTRGYNAKSKESIVIRSSTHGKVEIKHLACSLFPKGFRPAFALTDGYLLLATSPAAILRFKKSADSRPKSPLFHLSFQELAEFLTNHEAGVLQHIKSKSGIPPAAARPWLANAVAVLRIFDRLELRQEMSARQLTLRLRLVAANEPRTK